MQLRADHFGQSFIALCLAAGNALADAPATAVHAQPAPSVAGAMPPGPAFADETLVNRYTALSLLPSPADLDPTKVVAQVSFPRINTKTVGEAIRYLLVRTGYELVDAAQLHPQVTALFAKRLPDSQRSLGPYQVDTMLGILIGPAFVVATDHANRVISFQPAPLANTASGTDLQVQRTPQQHSSRWPTEEPQRIK